MKIMRALWRPRSFALIACGAVITGVVAAAPADGVGSGTNWPSVANAVPAAFTPNITDGTVFAITQVANLVIVGGSFTGVQNHGSTTTLPRSRVLGFDASTGAVSTTFAPSLDGTVQAVLPGPIANTVYVAGAFSNVNGVKSKGITLLSTSTGAIVSGFKPPALNGIVYSIGMAAGRLYLAGSFTTANSIAHGGLATLRATTGALDPFMNVQTAGHHNYNGTGANGAVGPRAMAINAAGTRAVVLGNFKTADGLARDQAVMIDLDGASAAVDTTWATSQFTAACSRNAFDTYVTDVEYSADGSYFAITATGGATTNNIDGTPSLCDTASRWESSTTGTNVKPTWVDFTGRDTLWSVAVTGSAIYVGGHQRWLNNSNGADKAGAGAVPRPGVAALDPLSGVPMAWNPGRNPRGAGAYALFAGPSGLYVGSDTDYIGNFKYKHQKIAFFPLAGGQAPAATTTAQLPSNLYEAGPGALPSSDNLTYHSVSGTTVGPLNTLSSTGVAWSTTRGAFVVGNTIFYGSSDGVNFSRASFDGSTVGPRAIADPYNDPTWASVQTGSGQTYLGLKSGYYGEMAAITGAFYSNGKLFYSQANKPALYWRWFSPDSGTIGSQEFNATSAGLSFVNITGMVASGSTLYYASKLTGALHSISFNSSTGTVSGADTIFDGANDWRARSLFLYGSPNVAPTASATSSCNGLTCSFNGAGSQDSDGTVTSYDWNFGDGTAHGTGVNPSHTYATANTYQVTLTVTDNGGAVSAPWPGSVTVQPATTAVAFVAQSGFNGLTASPSVSVAPGVSPGDTELLIVTAATNGVTTTAPTGFTQVAQQTNAPMETTVFQRVASAGDASSVTVPLASSVRVDLQLLSYSGVAVGPLPLATAADANTASHTTPSIAVTTPGSWVLTYWSDRNSATTANTWVLPSGVLLRGTGVGTGGGHTDSVVADSNGPVSTGTYPGQTADAGQIGGKGDTVTIVLTPGT